MVLTPQLHQLRLVAQHLQLEPQLYQAGTEQFLAGYLPMRQSFPLLHHLEVAMVAADGRPIAQLLAMAQEPTQWRARELQGMQMKQLLIQSLCPQM